MSIEPPHSPPPASWRQRVLSIWRGVSGDAQANPLEQQRLTAEVPGPDGVALFKIEVFTQVSPEGDGERLQLRARVQANFATALRPMLTSQAPRPALSSTTATPSGRALRLADRVSVGVQRVAQRALRVPLVRTMAESVVEHDVNTYIDLEASSSSLLDGARALVRHARNPALEQLGVVPDESADAPPLQTWAGESDQGFAQVSLLRLDERHFSAALRRALGNRPLKISAAVVNTVERPPRRRC